MVTASHDGTARVWNAADGRAVLTPLRHRSGVCAAEFSPDQRHLATVAEGHFARVWELEEGRAVTPPLVHSKAIQFLAFLGADGPLMTITEDQRVWLWELPSGLPLTLIGLPLDFNTRMSGPSTPIQTGWPGQAHLDSRPFSELERWSLLLTGHVVEGEGALLAVETARMRAAWRRTGPGSP